MPGRRHQHSHIERKLVGTALLEELSLEEHAGPLAELNNGTGHALVPEGKMRRCTQRDGLEVLHMPNPVRPLGAGVLTGHDIAAQIESNSIFAIHPTVLAEGVDSRQILP